MSADNVRQWIQTIGQTIGVLAIPVVVVIYGNKVAESNARSDVNARYVQVAVQVLAGPANDSTRGMRAWAAQVLKAYSPVPFASADSILVRSLARLLFSEAPIGRPYPDFSPDFSVEKVAVQPKRATLRAGDSLQFSASVVMSSSAPPNSVSWRATGGTINAVGVFKAGSVPGDFVVIGASGPSADTARVKVLTRPRD